MTPSFLFSKMLRAEGYGNVAEAILHSSDFHLHKVAEEAAHAEVTLLSETVVEETQPASTTEKTTPPTSTTTEKVTTAAPVPEETTKLASTTPEPTEVCNWCLYSCQTLFNRARDRLVMLYKVSESRRQVIKVENLCTLIALHNI